jgi:hypothetical protein
MRDDQCFPFVGPADLRPGGFLGGRFAPVRAELLPPLPPRRRMPQAVDTSTSHLGFRLVVRAERRSGGRG